MIYQQILKITYVFNLVNQYNNNLQNGHPSNHVEIVKLEDTFYIKDANKNLYLIQNGMRNFIKIENILNTCIYFEKYKTKPVEGFLGLSKITNIRQFNIELLKFLYFQYSIDKSYFDD